MSSESNNPVSDINRIYDKIDKIDYKLDNKFDRISNRLDNVEKELIVYNEELKHHIQGVILAREQNDLLKQHVELKLKEIQISIEPIKKHVGRITNVTGFLKGFFNGTLKFIGAAGVVITIYAKFMGYF